MQTKNLNVLAVPLDLHRTRLVQRIVYHVRPESISTLKEKKHVWFVKLDAQRTSQATIKVHVLYVLSVNKRHELVVQSVKIVVLADMELAAKIATKANIANRLVTIQRSAATVVVDGTNQTLDKQAVFRARLENINTLKEKKHVWTVKLDVQPVSQAIPKVHVLYVLSANKRHEMVALNVKIVVLEDTVLGAKIATKENIVAMTTPI